MIHRSSQTSATLLVYALVAASLFLLATHYRPPPTNRMVTLSDSHVVIAAPLQIVMYAGDRFLAADLEAMRVAAIGPSDEERLADYRIRAHGVIAQLNPCHEDNLYLANATLTWGGAPDAGIYILERATECRFWDDIPPLFLGFNRYFFDHDLDGAQKAINIAALRSDKNRVGLQKLSIVMASKKFDDLNMAATYLRTQRDEATDPRLAEMLDRRLQRVQGLITLRDAQDRFEMKYGRPLTSPNELIVSGVLKTLPQDPMRLGYEFVDGSFRLRAANIGGVEIR